MFRPRLLPVAIAAAFGALLAPAHATIDLIAQGSLPGTLSDLSGLGGPLENGVAGNLLGGLGSGLAWAGGNTFLALPDRGPNAVAWNSAVDDTTSYIPRFQTLQLSLSASSSGALPYTLTPTLEQTTLLYSSTPLNYGPVTPALNSAGKYYFSGRSDNFVPGLSTNPMNARLDTESIRVANDGNSVYISDEYGPYVYQFDRSTGARLKTFDLPSSFAIANQSAQGAAEISGNSSGRVANKGMEGLAITPDGKTLVGFVQSPLAQDGGDGGRANRIVSIDIATGQTHQYAYDNLATDSDGKSKAFNSSEILALNSHEFLVLERDGKGLGDDSSTKFKSIYKVDLAGATDVSALSGAGSLLAVAANKSLFLDLKSVLNAHGISDDKIPAKLEGMGFGADVMVDGVLKHTLYVANDNDFLAASPKLGLDNPNQWMVFAFSDADLNGSSFVPQAVAAVPEPQTYALMLAGLAAIALRARRRKAR